MNPVSSFTEPARGKTAVPNLEDYPLGHAQRLEYGTFYMFYVRRDILCTLCVGPGPGASEDVKLQIMLHDTLYIIHDTSQTKDESPIER